MPTYLEIFLPYLIQRGQKQTTGGLALLPLCRRVLGLKQRGEGAPSFAAATHRKPLTSTSLQMGDGKMKMGMGEMDNAEGWPVLGAVGGRPEFGKTRSHFPLAGRP